MIVKQITQEEFAESKKEQNGCTALPGAENGVEEQNIKPKDELGRVLDKITNKLANVTDKNIISETLNEGLNLDDEYIRNSRAMFKMHGDNRKHLKSLSDANSGDDDYSDESKFDKKLQMKIQEESRTKNINIEKYGKIICAILKQMHQGVLTEGSMSVRKEGIYPYRCQGEMTEEQVIAELLKKKAEVYMVLKTKEKVKTMDAIYNSLDKLNFKITTGDYRRPDAEVLQEEVIYLEKPFLMVDDFAGRDDDDVKPFYLTGFKVGFDGEITWLGITLNDVRRIYEKQKTKDGVISQEDEKIVKADAYQIPIDNISVKDIIGNSDVFANDNMWNRQRRQGDISISHEMKVYLNKRFEKVLEYSLNTFLDKIKLTNDLFVSSQTYLKQKGSKWLIMGELLNSVEQEGMVR